MPFDPDADRGEMRRQQQVALRACPAAQQRQQRRPPSATADAAQRHRERRPRTAWRRAERRDQDDLRRRRPDQHGRRAPSTRAEAELMRQRADADVGADQHVEEHRGPRRTPAPPGRLRRSNETALRRRWTRHDHVP